MPAGLLIVTIRENETLLNRYTLQNLLCIIYCKCMKNKIICDQKFLYSDKKDNVDTQYNLSKTML